MGQLLNPMSKPPRAARSSTHAASLADKKTTGSEARAADLLFIRDAHRVASATRRAMRALSRGPQFGEGFENQTGAHAVCLASGLGVEGRSDLSPVSTSVRMHPVG